MNKLIHIISTFLILALSPSIFGAASDEVKTSSSDFETTTFEDEVYDPLEGINRAVFSFNFNGINYNIDISIYNFYNVKI